MKTQTPQTIFLKDYRPPQFFIDTADLHIDLGEEWTTVKARLKCRRNTASTENTKSLVLDGQKMELQNVRLDNVELIQEQFQVDDSHLTIPDVPETFVLETEVRIQPQNNTALEGLYKSSKMFCTQCESEGFRNITYFLDRPDVMSLYSTNNFCRSSTLSSSALKRKSDRFRKVFRRSALGQVGGPISKACIPFCTCRRKLTEHRRFVHHSFRTSSYT